MKSYKKIKKRKGMNYTYKYKYAICIDNSRLSNVLIKNKVYKVMDCITSIDSDKYQMSEHDDLHIFYKNRFEIINNTELAELLYGVI